MPIAQIPKVMQDAVLAVEDARFYKHSGVDYVGVLRAGLANFGEGHSAQGASTITMQVARNFYLSTEKTFTRKIYEMLLSLKIESLLSKDQILEIYMNQIALGQRAYGFASASEIYFGKPLKDITVAEAAMLAGLPKAPSANNPIVNPERATRRQRYIIDRMLENGFITVAAARRGAEAGAEVPRAVGSRGARRVRRRAGAPDDLQPVRRRGLHARPERLPDAQLRRADARLSRPAQGHHGLREAPGLSRPRGLHRPAGRPRRARRPHRRGAAGLSRQRRAARRGRHRGVAEEGRRHAAERRVGDGHRRRPEAGDLGARRPRRTRRRRSARARSSA